MQKKNQTYVLCIELEKNKRILVGRLGIINFKKGHYFYIGSAKRNLNQRIRRHLRSNKKLFWHIDYLLNSKAKIKQVWVSDRKGECETAKRIYRQACPPKSAKGGRRRGYDFIKGFGCSDCSCPSHLFFIPRPDKSERGLLEENGFKHWNEN